MRSHGTARLLVLVALGSLALATRTDTGVATTQQDLLRRVDVTITDNAIKTRSPTDPAALVRGSVGDFRVTNASGKPRNFVVGTAATPVLAPGESFTMHVDVTVRGALPYRVTVNCAPNLHGTLNVF